MSDINSVINDVATPAENTNGVESLPAVNNQPEPAQNQPSTQQPAKGQEGEGGKKEDPKKNPPFNEHPRWKEIMGRVKSLEAENKQLKEGGQPQQKPGQQGQPSTQPNSAYEQQVESVLSEMPEFQFKEEYGNYGEFGKDVIKAVLTTIAAVTEKNAKAQEEASKAEYEGFRADMVEIEDDLGDPEKFDEFKSFFMEIVKDPKMQNQSVNVKRIYQIYLKEIYNKNWTPAQKANQSKIVASKIAKTTKPALNGKGDKPSYDFIQNSSMQDIADAMSS